ncbi:lamin tail domain-containing protein [Sphingobacteriales bacterium CHB3]|nr:lamin tail domain-containing protein [Sphingobacteriales bacterium CHB3]
MTLRALVPLILIGSFGLLVTGCEVETESQPPLSYPPANHIVINEVYTLPGTNPNAHSWLELFNPTSQTFDLSTWSLNFTTVRLEVRGLKFWTVIFDTIRTPTDTTIVPRLREGARQYLIFALDSVFRPYDVPIGRVTDSVKVRIAGTTTYVDSLKYQSDDGKLEVRPNEFLTLVNNLERLRVYTSIGPGTGPQPTSSVILPFLESNFSTNMYEEARTLRDSLNPFTTIPDTLYGYAYLFLLQQTDQIVLKDAAGNTVDVVRYGSYSYTGPGADPYPNNRSVGAIPEFESIARYAGAYSTKNTANDFYITHAGLRPIPHWLSQLYKR